MKKLLAILLLISFSFHSCDERDEPETFEVTYEVLTSAGNWHGEYIDEKQEKICLCGLPLPSSGWTYSFSVKHTPYTLHLDATTASSEAGEAGAPDVTTNIFVNGDLVATATSNWAPGVASADYVIP